MGGHDDGPANGLRRERDRADELLEQQLRSQAYTQDGSQGFATQNYQVLVQSARTTDVKATLKVGGLEDVVEVSGGAAPLVETSSNAINTTIDMKQIEDLPLAGRNVAQLSQLTAGYNGTWNGLPSFAQSNSVDGVVGNTNRWRYQTLNSAQNTAVTPRPGSSRSTSSAKLANSSVKRAWITACAGSG